MLTNAATAVAEIDPAGQPSPVEEAAANCRQLTEKMPPTERTLGRIDEQFDRVREDVAKRLDLFVRGNYRDLDRLYEIAQTYPRLVKRLDDLFGRFDRLGDGAVDLMLRDDIERLRREVGGFRWSIRCEILSPYWRPATVVDPLRDAAKKIDDDLAKLGDLAGRLWDRLKLTVRRERSLAKFRAIASAVGPDRLREMNRQAARQEQLPDAIVEAVIAEATR